MLWKLPSINAHIHFLFKSFVQRAQAWKEESNIAAFSNISVSKISMPLDKVLLEMTPN